MLESELSAAGPDPKTTDMDRQVMAYLRGELPLASAVDACIRALGPRPLLGVRLAHSDATIQARVHALHDALAALSQGTG